MTQNNCRPDLIRKNGKGNKQLKFLPSAPGKAVTLFSHKIWFGTYSCILFTCWGCSHLHHGFSHSFQAFDGAISSPVLQCPSRFIQQSFFFASPTYQIQLQWRNKIQHHLSSSQTLKPSRSFSILFSSKM